MKEPIVEVTGEGLYNLWLYHLAAHPPIYSICWGEQGKAAVKAALTPGARILHMYAMSVHVQQANGKILIIEADLEYPPTPARSEFSDGHLWKDNVPRPEEGSRTNTPMKETN